MKWKQSASTITKKMLNKAKGKNTRTKILTPKKYIYIFNLSSKKLSRYQTNILLRVLRFTPISKCNNIGLKSDIQNRL